jgi:hypothetical protein
MAGTYEDELAEYLQERIKPNLNRGAIPLLARSIAKELAQRKRPDDESEETMSNDEPRDKTDEEYEDEPRDDEEVEDEELDEEPEAEDDEDVDDEEEPEAEGEADDPVAAFEEEMHQLQEDLGDEWIVRSSVQNDEAWLTAEKEDGSQHVEGPTADVLREAVELLEGGGDAD